MRRYLSKKMLHLGLFGPEAFDLLVDSGIFLQLLQRRPLAVQVGTEEKYQSKKYNSLG